MTNKSCRWQASCTACWMARWAWKPERRWSQYTEEKTTRLSWDALFRQSTRLYGRYLESWNWLTCAILFCACIFFLISHQCTEGSYEKQKRDDRSFDVEELRWLEWVLLVIIWKLQSLQQVSWLIFCEIFFIFFPSENFQVTGLLRDRLADASGSWFLLHEPFEESQEDETTSTRQG